MGSHKADKIKRANYYNSRLREVIDSKRSPCINCGKPGLHFVPPSLGEHGFFICELEQPKDSSHAQR